MKTNRRKFISKSLAGGLATGLKSYHKSGNSVWIGWPGIDAETADEEKLVIDLLKKFTGHKQ